MARRQRHDSSVTRPAENSFLTPHLFRSSSVRNRNILSSRSWQWTAALAFCLGTLLAPSSTLGLPYRPLSQKWDLSSVLHFFSIHFPFILVEWPEWSPPPHSSSRIRPYSYSQNLGVLPYLGMGFLQM